MPGPYTTPAITQLYELLFCDRPDLLYTPEHTPDPFFSSSIDNSVLQETAGDRSSESRLRLFALHELKRRGLPADTGELLGVIVEHGLEEGLDVLAAYRDGRARYFNYSGKVIVWEAPDTTMQETVDRVFGLGQQIVKRIGPWEGPRKPPPVTGQMRLTFLMDGNLYFGEGPVNALFHDPMAGPLLKAMTELMQQLIAFANQDKQEFK